MFVWEASPELKRAEARKQMMYLVVMVVVLIVVATYRMYNNS